MTNKLTATALILALALPTAGFASGDMDSAKRDEITAAMTAQGYEIRKITVEDGMFEVYAMKDGKRMELYLDADMKVVKTKVAN